MGDFAAMQSTIVASNRPAELIYRIEVPNVVKSAQLDLDVAERHLKLRYMDVYDLHISLPYPVFDKKGVAKYDKASKTLTVTLPVRPPPAVAMTAPSDIVETNSHENDHSQHNGGEKSVLSGDEGIVKSLRADKQQHSRWVQGANEESKAKNEDRSREIKRLAAEAVIRAQDAAALEQATKVASTTATSRLPTHPSVDPVVKEALAFIPAATFRGSRCGYAFQTKSLGTGYYLDATRSGSSVGADGSQPPSTPSVCSLAQEASLPPPSRVEGAGIDRVALDKIESYKRQISSMKLQHSEAIFELD